MTQPAAFTDAEAVARAWINSRTTTLVGQGKPLSMGCHFQHVRSPGTGAYCYVTRVGGYDDQGEAPIDYARLSFEVMASTKEATAKAAVALANELRVNLDGMQTTVTVDGSVRRILGATQITGPTWRENGTEPRYIVDAILMTTPGP